ncbi:transposase family protein [Acrocarpospora catenulata]|uniref:transposase family protein n=1 Tax=Acrocarpospora catenulata TaxID=2836182 RepID=UPI00355703D3
MSVTELLSVVFPHLEHVRIDRVLPAGRSVRIEASTHPAHAICPDCGMASKRVHSRYRRRVDDTAISGRETVIYLGSAGSSVSTPCARRQYSPSRCPA